MVYVALLRGINVGGNNKVSMAELKVCLEDLGLESVKTYINSGNVIFESDKQPKVLAKQIEEVFPGKFDLAGPIKVLILSHAQLEKVIKDAPEGFGEEPGKYHSDVAFLIDTSAAVAFEHIETNPEVDTAWAGDGVIYYQRLSAKLTKSRLSKVIGKPIYKSMTIRTWNTVRKLAQLAEDIR